MPRRSSGCVCVRSYCLAAEATPFHGTLFCSGCLPTAASSGMFHAPTPQRPDMCDVQFLQQLAVRSKGCLKAVARWRTRTAYIYTGKYVLGSKRQCFHCVSRFGCVHAASIRCERRAIKLATFMFGTSGRSCRHNNTQQDRCSFCNTHAYTRPLLQHGPP